MILLHNLHFTLSEFVGFAKIPYSHPTSSELRFNTFSDWEEDDIVVDAPEDEVPVNVITQENKQS